MDSIIAFLMNWGYMGMAISAFLAASILPFSSEAVMVGLLAAGLDMWALIVWGTVGNVLGSNIFNILMVLGIASAISPIAFIQENIIDIIVLVVFSLTVWIMAWTKREIKRGEGIIMLLMYAAYTAYIIIR